MRKKAMNRALLLGFLVSLPLNARSAPKYDCERTNKLVNQLFFITDNPDSEERQSLTAAATAPDRLMLECVYLQENKTNSITRVPRLNNLFHPFADKNAPAPFNELFTICAASECKYQEHIQSLLQTVCSQDLKLDPEKCAELQKPALVINNQVGRKPLPLGRKIAGSALIIVGGASAVLGAVHMGTPVFRSESGCVEYGLNHPCLSASRFGVGGALLGLGLAAIGGGIFALAWPTGEYVIKQEASK